MVHHPIQCTSHDALGFCEHLNGLVALHNLFVSGVSFVSQCMMDKIVLNRYLFLISYSKEHR